jgi:G-box binding protein MFMR
MINFIFLVKAYYGPGMMPPPYYSAPPGHAPQPYMWAPQVIYLKSG